MSLLMYAVSEAEDRVTGVGMAGACLEAVEGHGLTAIVTDGAPPELEPTEDALWEYEQVIERLMTGASVLPARFGSVLDDRAAVLELLSDRRSELRGALDRVRGTVEFGLTAGWQEHPDTTPAQTGTAYLLGRLELHRRATELARHLAPLASLARENRQRLLPTPTLPLTAAYLLDAGCAREFIELVARLDSSLPAFDLVCTGPWPPYSFVTGIS